jgi:hypothetical protein
LNRFIHVLGVVFVANTLLVTAALSKPAGRPKGTGSDCWLLTQLNPNSPYSHSQIALIGKEGIVISADDVKLFVPAPFKDVGIYNSSQKQYFIGPLKTWFGKYGALPFSKTHKYMAKGVRGKIGNVEADQYFMMQGQGKDARKLREVWATDVIEAERPVKEILQHLCGLPEGSVDGVPLRVMRLEGGRKEVLLNTLSVKRIPTPKGAFTQPSNYRRVQSEITLMLNYGKQSALKDLLEGTTNSRK